MTILTIRTDKSISEIAIYEDKNKLQEAKWEAHRTLADSIHLQIKKLLETSKLDWHNIQGLVCFKGPGSFTGLRIGISVANALSYSLNCPVVSQAGDNWQSIGIDRLLNHENEKVALPEYGAEAKITKPKK